MDFAEDIIRRARWAIDHNDHQPDPAWSAGERLIVALVLTDDAYLATEGHTKAEVLSRLAGDAGSANVGAWLAYVRGALEDDDDDR